MDEILFIYLPDPRDPTKVVSIVQEHAKFIGGLEGSFKALSNLRQQCNPWDQEHDNEAATLLIDSLDPKFYKGYFLLTFQWQEHDVILSHMAEVS